MSTEALKKSFGNDYPAAAVVNGVRMPLALERQFSRYYHSGQPNTGGCFVSRFMDGSASMTAEQLQREWPTWTREQRTDFCQSCCWLHQQSDFRNMLRFIMQHGSSEDWPGIALLTASYLPCDEAFPFLLGVAALHPMDINVIQAIAETKHPDAEATLRQHLRAIWDNPALWNDDDFLNWVASYATACIQHLVELGASPADFDEQVRRLSEHVCGGNRDSCRRSLSKHYSWLK
jgi:hypothetical protein